MYYRPEQAKPPTVEHEVPDCRPTPTARTSTPPAQQVDEDTVIPPARQGVEGTKRRRIRAVKQRVRAKKPRPADARSRADAHAVTASLVSIPSPTTLPYPTPSLGTCAATPVAPGPLPSSQTASPTPPIPSLSPEPEIQGLVQQLVQRLTQRLVGERWTHLVRRMASGRAWHRVRERLADKGHAARMGRRAEQRARAKEARAAAQPLMHANTPRGSGVWQNGEWSQVDTPGSGAQARPTSAAATARANAEAAATCLHELAPTMTGGFWKDRPLARDMQPDDWPRGADARASLYPRVRPRHDPTSTACRANDHVAESSRWLREEAADPILAAQPHMKPVPQRGAPELTTSGLELFPEDLARDPADVRRIETWCAAYDKEFKRMLKATKTGKGASRFRYNVLEGGKRGLIIHDFLKEEYKGVVWDCRAWIRSGKKEPCTPMTPFAAQEHSEWNLGEMLKAAQEMDYPDMDIIMDLCVNGCRSHSEHVGSNTVILAPNYPGFWKHPSFAEDKVKEDTEGFAKPKLTEGFPFPPFLTCRVHPRSVAEQVSVEGVVKLRITHDPGFPRPEFGRKWAPGESIAWNDGVDLNDPDTHPAVQYGSVNEYSAALAVLRTANIPIGQTKTDVRGYFRGMTMAWDEVAYAMQWVDAGGIRADWNLSFGQSPNPQISQRCSTFCEAKIMIEVDKAQARFKADGRVPAEYAARLAAWEADRTAQRSAERAAQHREWTAAGLDEAACAEKAADLDRQQGPAARWCIGQLFVDDFFHGTWTFFIDTVAAVVSQVMADFKIEMADGRWDQRAGKHTKNKTETVYENAPMEVLGVIIDPGKGEKRLSEQRAEMYAALGESMLSKPVVNRPILQSWLGRMVFASMAIVGLRAVYLRLLSALRQGWSSRNAVSLSKRAWEAIKLAVDMVRDNQGSALWPMRREPGVEGRPVIWSWTDAARDTEAPPDQFVGYGVILYVEHTDTVYATRGRWTGREQAHLDITSLELAAEEFARERAIALAEELGLVDGAAQAGSDGFDLIQVADNKGARAVANGMAPTSPALRVILEQRMARRARTPTNRVLAVWAHREALDAADAASKDDDVRMYAELQRQFGADVRVADAGQVPQGVRNLDAAILAVRAYKAPGARG